MQTVPIVVGGSLPIVECGCLSVRKRFVVSHHRFKILPRGRQTCCSAIVLLLTCTIASAQTIGDARTSCPSGLECTASGSDRDRLKPDVDGIVGQALRDQAVETREPALSAIVGISWHGRRTYFGYGRNAAPYDPDTIVEIGSITKVFTTALLVEAVQSRGVSLDDRLIAYKDALGLGTLTACGGQVTLKQLANFSAGMPRLPDDLPANHDIERYSAKQFKAWVAGWTPNGSSPGSCSLPDRYLYSNASIGLLGYVVSSQLGGTYERLIADRITSPLRMSSTFMPDPDGSVPRALASRIAVGRTNDDRPAAAWPYFAWFAAGALRSDARDMLSFGEAALGNRDIDGAPPPPGDRERIASLESALGTAQATLYPVERPDGRLAFNQGLSWVQSPGDPARHLAPIYFKDGGTSGFSTIIVVNPAKDLAIFVAIGKTNVRIDPLGIRLARFIR